eukprot:8789354-Alexandrium_andersonii.AAC.1
MEPLPMRGGLPPGALLGAPRGRSSKRLSPESLLVPFVVRCFPASPLSSRMSSRCMVLVTRWRGVLRARDACHVARSFMTGVAS